MEESEDNMSAEEIKCDYISVVKKPKKRSLVERELETNLTARVTSPLTNRDATSTSRYGRARRLKADAEFYDPDKILHKSHKSPKLDKSPSKIQSPVYKMHASNSPIRIETPKRDVSLENQIESIYSENISLSRFGSEEKASKSATKKYPKVYIRKDLIQSKDKEDDTVVLIKNIFSPSKSTKKPNPHLSNYLERSTEKYNMKKPLNGYLNTSSVVKTLDFDGKKKKKDEAKKVLSKSDIFEWEAQCEYQVGDLAWARMGTYPFWPCIVTRDPLSGMFVKKKLFGRLERDVLHVTFLGDNGRRGWIVGSMLRNFFGQLEFEAARTNFTPEAKKKDPRLYAAFFISEKKTSQWQISVEEAEMLLREPKRLRIEILNDMLQKCREIKTTPKHEKSKRIARTNSDVSLSESLFDTLFSEDDSKGNDLERSRSKSRNRSLDVSDVVTACLDNMAAKTGITKIQRQSHMDRWLQKAKSKTPEKSQLKSHLALKIEKDNKVSNSAKFKKKVSKKTPPIKPYSFRKFAVESRNDIDKKLPSHQNEHNYSQRYSETNGPIILDDIEIEYENAEMFTSDVVEPGSGLGIISKVETLCSMEQTNPNNQNNINMTVCDELIMCDGNNVENIDNVAIQVCIERIEDEKENNQEQFIEKKNQLAYKKIDDSASVCRNGSELTGIEAVKIIHIESSESIKANVSTDKDLKLLTCNDDLNEATTSKNSHSDVPGENDFDGVRMDNESVNVCKPHIETVINSNSQIYINHPEPTIDQDTALKDVTIDFECNTNVMNENNCDSQNKIQDHIKKQHSALSNIDDFNGETIVTDVISNSLDKNIQRAALYVENTQHKEIQSYNCTDINKSDLSPQGMEVPNVIELKEYDDRIDNFPHESITIKKTNHFTLTPNILHITEQQFEDDTMQNQTVNNDIDTALVNTSVLPKKKSSKSKFSLSLKRTDEVGKIGSNAQFNPIICEYNKVTAENKSNENNLVSVGAIKEEIIRQKVSCQVKCTEINPGNKEDYLTDSNKEDSTLIENKISLINVSNMSDVAECNNCAIREAEENQCLTEVTLQTDACSEVDLIQRESNSANQCKDDNSTFSSSSLDEVDIDSNPMDDNEKSLADHELTINSLSRESAIETDNETDVVHEVETNVFESNDIENMSLQYDDEDEEIVINNDFQSKAIENITLQAGDNTESDKINCKLLYTTEYFKDPGFLKYLELKQDSLIDDNPNLTQEEVIKYLYKTWLYEESLKTDMKKMDDIQNACLVNGLKQSPIKIKLSLNKSSKKNRKTYKVQITDYLNDNIKNSHASDNKNDEFVIKNKTEWISKKDDSVSGAEEQKKSQRLRLNNEKNKNFEKKYFSNVTKDSYCDDILEPTTKKSETIEIDIGQSSNEINTNIDENTSDDKAFTSIENDEIENEDYRENQLSEVSELITQNGCHKDKQNPVRQLLQDFDPDSDSVYDSEEPRAVPQLRLTLCKTQSGYGTDGAITKNTTPHISEHKYEIKKDEVDSISVTSDCSEDSFYNKKMRTKDKLSADKRKRYNEPDFLKYLELKQDALIDVHPELTEKEITKYLYKTWVYEESLKNDIKKADDMETVTNLVKGLNQEPKIKTVRKKVKVGKAKHKDLNLDSEDITPKEKSKRKIIQPYYKEDFSDAEDDIAYFEVFTDANSAEVQRSEVQLFDDETNVEFVSEEIDEAEEYFRQLTVSKPNLFKGLLREKVCEICEKVGSLVKCKGCHDMFHIDCVKKKTVVIEMATPVRGRKKKKKNRGRKAKDYTNNLDPNECQSDEKSQDHNGSDEIQNTSAENELEFYLVTDANDFESRLSVKMKELLDNPENNLEYESYSSVDELDWDDIDYGECKIVDVKPRKKACANSSDYSEFKCKNCQTYNTPICFVCKLSISPKDKAEHRQRCQVAHCHKYYHLECLDHWPQTQFIAGELSRINKNSNEFVEALTCPRHVCHTCVCDDPRGCKTRFSGDKLARCIRCPATYHTFTKCLPAGSQILTASHIICPRHYEHRPGKVPCHVNTGWCFICALGGTLICCEYCPTSFHAECLNISPPEGGYMCEDCETGRLPLYGEMVWVKLGHYRWWPGIILHPSEIPQNVLAVKHSQGEFVVRFFGQYDYYWVNRGRVFPFQEGDSGKVSSQKSKIDAAFTMAIEHAQRACEILKTASPNEEESIDIASSLLPPHYVRLKVNRPCGSLCGKKIDIEESSLTQCECDPNYFDPCGPYTQCLNRMLLTECGSVCRAGDRCNNRAFEKRLYPKMVPYRTPHRGWGLKALEDIKAGQFVIEYVGELIDEEEFKRRMRRKHEVRDENFYFLTLDKERMIDAGPKGNLARFMNHSCQPNCETQKWTVLGDVRVGLFALYDIPANSELTFNYNLESTGIEKKQCMCGAKRCSGYIGAKPKQDDQPKKIKPPVPTKRTYKKRKITETSPSSSKPKQRMGRPIKPTELTEIEKDLMIIKNATNSISSDSESSRLSIDSKESRGLKRRRTVDTLSPSTKKFKTEKLLEGD